MESCTVTALWADSKRKIPGGKIDRFVMFVLISVRFFVYRRCVKKKKIVYRSYTERPMFAYLLRLLLFEIYVMIFIIFYTKFNT